MIDIKLPIKFKDVDVTELAEAPDVPHRRANWARTSACPM